jgi:hypothetical protein
MALQHSPGSTESLAFNAAQGHDALLVLDADCRLDRHALRAFDRELAAGHKVLQAKVVASNPDASAISLAVAVGNLLENDFFYAPKDRLGWSVLLRGTGMVLHREVLERLPFRALSQVEDAEYTVRLLRAGWAVHFLADVSVYSDFPADHVELSRQRQRWTVGNFWLGKRLALGLLIEGLTRRRWQLADTGWTILVAIRPLLLLQLLLATAATALTAQLSPGPLAAGLLFTVAGVWLIHALYWATGVVCLGLTRKRFGLLWHFPLLGGRLVAIFLSGLLRGVPQKWTRANRPAPSA